MDHPPAPDAASLAGASWMPYSTSLTLFASAARLWATHGPDAGTIAALAGGLGTFLIGSVNVAKEFRAWREQRLRVRAAAFDVALARVLDADGRPAPPRDGRP